MLEATLCWRPAALIDLLYHESDVVEADGECRRGRRQIMGATGCAALPEAIAGCEALLRLARCIRRGIRPVAQRQSNKSYG